MNYVEAARNGQLWLWEEFVQLAHELADPDLTLKSATSRFEKFPCGRHDRGNTASAGERYGRNACQVSDMCYGRNVEQSAYAASSACSCALSAVSSARILSSWDGSRPRAVSAMNSGSSSEARPVRTSSATPAAPWALR